MADVSMEVVERYAQGVRDVSSASSDALVQSLMAIDLRDREMVEDLVMAACRTASQAGADYAAQFYRGMSILQTGSDFDAKGLSSYDRQATIVAIRGIYRQADLGDGELDEEMLIRLLAERVEFEANRSSKVGVWRNGSRDSREVRYARVPTGAETCAWCIMTAGLGFWYMTEESASHTHRSCDCVIIPEIGGIHDVHIRGYDSTVYRDMWRQANALRANGDLPLDMQQHIAAQKAAKGGAYREDTNGTLYVMRHMYGLK